MSEHNENEHEEIKPARPAKGEPYVLSKTDYRIVHEGGRRTAAIATIVAVVILGIAMIAGITVDDLAHVATDPLERACLPIITGLIGVLGGLYASGSRT